MIISCEFTAKGNLSISQGKNQIVIPSNRIDEFILALTRHCSKQGDGRRFVFGLEPDGLIVTY